MDMINMIDFEKIKAIYKLGRDIDLKDTQELIRTSRKRTYQPLEYIIQEGSLTKDIFYIQKGLVRIFMINNKGEEITTNLRCEHEIIASPYVILFDEPCRFYFQAIEPTTLFSLNYGLIQEIIEKNPVLEKNRKFFLHKLLKQSMQRVESFVLLTPEKRYIKYVEENPEIINRVPNKYIANVLGITPVSLSRIRKRIVEKNRNQKS
jgi:CRP-like cAMP-binding protein